MIEGIKLAIAYLTLALLPFAMGYFFVKGMQQASKGKCPICGKKIKLK